VSALDVTAELPAAASPFFGSAPRYYGRRHERDEWEDGEHGEHTLITDGDILNSCEVPLQLQLLHSVGLHRSIYSVL
jgi:hypothetical protein